jgi:hypothetical protein
MQYFERDWPHHISQSTDSRNHTWWKWAELMREKELLQFRLSWAQGLRQILDRFFACLEGEALPDWSEDQIKQKFVRVEAVPNWLVDQIQQKIVRIE